MEKSLFRTLNHFSTGEKKSRPSELPVEFRLGEKEQKAKNNSKTERENRERASIQFTGLHKKGHASSRDRLDKFTP